MKKYASVAAAAATLIAPTVATAAVNTHGPAKVAVHACVRITKHGKTLRLAKKCNRNERGMTIRLAYTGKPGPQGPHGLPGANGTNGANGANGKDGAQGPQGLQGLQGLKGDTGLAGAFWSVEQYPEGAGSGGVATVACDATDATRSQQYVAISGGVQDTDNNTSMSTLQGKMLPIAASFPGRMDWNTNTPKPNRLDGWIVQMGQGDAQDTPMSVWALCVPKANIGPTVTNSQDDVIAG